MPAATALAPFLDDRLGQKRGRGSAVAGDIGGLGGDLAHHLRAHVLELVFEFDFLGDGDPVLADARCTKGLVEDDVASFRTKRDPHRIGEDVDAGEHFVAGLS